MTLRKNSGILFTAEVFAAVASFGTGLIAARTLSVDDFGRLMTGFSIAQILLALLDGGAGPYVARELARHHDHGLHTLQDLLSIRFFFMGLIYLILIPITFVFFSDRRLWIGVVAVTPAIFLLGTVELQSWGLRGVNNMWASAFLRNGSRWVLFCLCCCIFFLDYHFFGVLLAYNASALVSFLVGLRVMHRSIGPIQFYWPTLESGAKLFLSLYKVGGVLVFFMLFTRIDMLMVQNWTGNTGAGIFGVATRVFEGFRLIPIAVFGALVPAFSLPSSGQEAQLRQLGEVVNKLTTLATLLAVSLTIVGPWLIPWLFGANYSLSVPLLFPLLWAGIFMFVNQVITAFYFSGGHHKVLWFAAVGGIGSNILINALCLNRGGPMAASWARLISEIVIFSTFMISFHRTVSTTLSPLVAKTFLLASGGVWCLLPLSVNGFPLRPILLCAHVIAIEWLFSRGPFLPSHKGASHL